MTKVEKTIQNYEGRNLVVLFVHRCRAKTCKGIANLLNTKYVIDRVDLGDDMFLVKMMLQKCFVLVFLNSMMVTFMFYLGFRR